MIFNLGVRDMKKIIILVLLGLGTTIISMDPPFGLKAKEKERNEKESNSSTTSGSGASLSQFEAINLKDAPQPGKTQGKGIIVIHSLEDLDRLMKDRGIDLDEIDKHNSIVYLPKMDLVALEREITPQHDEEHFVEVVNFYKELLKQNSGKDISKIERRLAQKFKELHDSPPATPHEEENEEKRKAAEQFNQAQKAVQALRLAAVHQSTLRTNREQDKKRSPVGRRMPREAKPFEILERVAADPNVQENLKVLETIAFNLLGEKVTETQNSKTTTTWVTAGIGALATIGSSLITYFSTKNSNNNC